MEIGEIKNAVEPLVLHATDVIARSYVARRHQIAASLLAHDGAIYDGLHIEAMVGRASICAESVSLGRALLDRSARLALLAAVRHPSPDEPGARPRVVTPCGLCREVLLDYEPDLHVVIEQDSGWTAVPLANLLPHKYVGTKWKNQPAYSWRTSPARGEQGRRLT